MAPGPTPTLTIDAPAPTRSRALGGHHVAGRQRQAEVQRRDGLDGVDHLGLVTVRGVDYQHVGAGLGQRARLDRDVAVDADGGGDPQPAARRRPA